jgi:hypothetical protein
MEAPMTMRKKTGGRGRKPAAVGVCARGLAVDAKEREHLVEACAFFRADHFRNTDPDHLRAQDREDAAVDIDAALGHRRRPAKAARPRRQAKGAGK